MVRVFRKREGRRVITALSGPEALQILATTKVDVILTDYSMPDMSGVELIERARAIAPRVISIMVTGYPELPDVVSAQARGLVLHVISKPWKASEVYETVERALATRASDEADVGLEPRSRG
jgi:CheY-like chemotaxis protein